PRPYQRATHHNRSQGRHSLLLQSSCPKHRDQGKDVRRDHCSDGYGSKKGLTTRRRYGKSHHGGKRRNVFRSACHRAGQHYTRRIVGGPRTGRNEYSGIPFSGRCTARSEERRVGKSVDLERRRRMKKKKTRDK